jgi:hypothetical protein
MRRRTLFVVVAGLAVVSAAVVIVLWPSQPHRITKENCDRIHAGMTRAEVESILGPPGEYTTGPIDYVLSLLAGDKPIVDGQQVFLTWGETADPSRFDDCWSSDDQVLVLQFDFDGTVRLKFSGPTARVVQSPFNDLLWRAKRQWHRWFP